MLDNTDMQILKFIYKKGKVHKNEILKKFPENKCVTSYRIQKLEQQEFYGFREPIENSSYILSEYEDYDINNDSGKDLKLYIYYLTDYGKVTVQNNKFKFKLFLYSLLINSMKSIFCPIIVSVIITLLTLWINKLFT